MRFTPDMQSSLEKMMQLSWAEADALRIDLADIEAAQKSAQASLSALSAQACTERERTRRRRLFAMIETLSDTKESLSAKLAAKSAELIRLEGLVARNAGAEAGSKGSSGLETAARPGWCEAS